MREPLPTGSDPLAGEAAALRRLRAVPAWAWLVGLVVASTLIRYALARRVAAPWIMIDELIYSELAKSFASGGHFMIRDHASNIYEFVYPILISPAWAIFNAVPDTYAAAKAINSLVMSLAAVPAYFLARRVLGTWLSLAAAALTVAVPSMVYTATLMTENAFYPMFLTVALVFVMWLDRPTLVHSTLLVGALPGRLPDSNAGHRVPTRHPHRAVPPFRTRGTPPLPADVPARRRRGARRGRRSGRSRKVAVRRVRRVRGRRARRTTRLVTSRAGSSTTCRSSTFRSESCRSLRCSILALGSRSLPRPQRVFVAASVALSFWLVLEVAIFASEQSFRVEERNMFYLAPLFLIGLLVWIDRGMPRKGVAATAAIAVAAALPGAVPYSSFVGLNAISDTIALIPLGSLVEAGLGLDDVGLVVVFSCAVAALLFLFVPRRYGLVLPLLVLAYFATQQQAIDAKHRQQSELSLFGGITAKHRDWIDRKVGSDAKVAAIWTGNTDKFTIWENEIFNRSVGTIYRTGASLPGDLDETAVTIDRGTGFLLGPDRSPIRSRYVLTDGSLALQGEPIAEDVKKGMILYRLNGAARQISRVEGLWPQDTWSKRTVTYTRLACTGGSLAVELQSDSESLRGPNRVVARTGGAVVGAVSVPREGTARLRVPLRPVAGRCIVAFRVSHLAVPAIVASDSTDTRPLGTHFNSFRFSPRAGTTASGSP